MDSRAIIVVLTILVMISCDNRNLDEAQENVDIPDPIRVHIGSNDLEWSNSQSDFVNFVPLALDSISLDLLDDTTLTCCRMLVYENELTKGELYFLYLCKSYSIPFAKVFGIQLDVLLENCPYPYGLIEYFQSDRENIKLILVSHFKKLEGSG